MLTDSSSSAVATMLLPAGTWNVALSDPSIPFPPLGAPHVIAAGCTPKVWFPPAGDESRPTSTVPVVFISAMLTVPVTVTACWIGSPTDEPTENPAIDPVLPFCPSTEKPATKTWLSVFPATGIGAEFCPLGNPQALPSTKPPSSDESINAIAVICAPLTGLLSPGVLRAESSSKSVSTTLPSTCSTLPTRLGTRFTAALPTGSAQ